MSSGRIDAAEQKLTAAEKRTQTEVITHSRPFTILIGTCSRKTVASKSKCCKPCSESGTWCDFVSLSFFTAVGLNSRSMFAAESRCSPETAPW